MPDTPLRILMINRSTAAQLPGGDSVQLHQTAQALREQGVEVKVCLADALDTTDWKVDLVHIFNLQTYADSWKAFQMARSRKLPVALSTIYWSPFSAWYWTSAPRRFKWSFLRKLTGEKIGEQFYCAWQGLRSRYAESWRVQRKLLIEADVLLPNSNTERALLRKMFGLAGKHQRWAVVPNGVDHRLFGLRAAPDPRIIQATGGRPTILQVGRISLEKNPLGLIRALWQDEIHLVFVGKKDDIKPEYYNECLINGEKRGRVHFFNWIPYEELPGVYASASVHAMPSWRETPGLTSLEAAACGLNLVSTCLGSAKEYFGEAAWYCHPAHSDSIRLAVMDALQNPAAAGLREKVLRQYTWELAAKETLNAYQQVVDQA